MYKSSAVKHRPIFITGIGTEIGKTISSAVFVEKLQADYWKPVQSGDLDNTDTDKVRNLVANNKSVFHPEAYRLTQPFSPHKSAELDNVKISLDSISMPVTDNQLIIEGAGGLLVPLNDKDLMIDLIKKFDAEVILVSQNYLGSINHTLMSVEILKARGLTVSKLVFNGIPNNSSEDIILKHTNLEIIRIPNFTHLDKQIIKEFVTTLVF